MHTTKGVYIRSHYTRGTLYCLGYYKFIFSGARAYYYLYYKKGAKRKERNLL